MIRRLIDLSLDNRLVVVALWAVAVVVGIYWLTQLPIDAVPDITNVQVLTDSPGLPPEEVGQYVTFPIETAMSGLPRIAEIRSLTKFGLSVVTVVFEEDTDIYWARQLVSDRLAQAREEIPRNSASRRWRPSPPDAAATSPLLVSSPWCAPRVWCRSSTTWARSWWRATAGRRCWCTTWEQVGGTEISVLETVRAATHQVARPVHFGVMIIILVYLPILALRGTQPIELRFATMLTLLVLPTAYARFGGVGKVAARDNQP